MKATGIVKHIDDEGRVLIPKEVRRMLRLHDGDPVEIFVDREGEAIIRKYSPIGEIAFFATEYAESLYEVTGHTIVISDFETVVAVAGANKNLLGRQVGPAVEKAMKDKKLVLIDRPENNSYCEGCPVSQAGKCDVVSELIAPVVLDNKEVIGAILMQSTMPGSTMGDPEMKLAQTAANFLAKQLVR